MMSETILNYAMAWLIKIEGGYVNDPTDSGGETKFGISKRQYPDLNIANLTIEQAKEIYQRDYWAANHCDQMPPAIGIMLLDGLVQHRPKTAVKILQHAISAKADGIIGPNTISLARSSNPHTTVRLMALGRLDLYEAIVKGNSTQAKFINGWRGRILDLYEFIVTNIYLGEED